MGESRTLVIDPVTRIEGHLRIQASTRANPDGTYTVSRASSSSTMVRGIEIIMKGRDPREAWAFAQRICGVCTVVHGVASVRAVENALGITVPSNAEMIRNLMIASQYLHDHVTHFYLLHMLDWVDVESAIRADPSRAASLQASMSSYANNSSSYFSDVRSKLSSFIKSGQLGIFAKGYWGHPAYKLSPEQNLVLMAHYLECLAWARNIVKLHTIFGGKDPHPNVVVGGMPCAISSVGGGTGPITSGTAINSASLSMVKDLITAMRTFVDQVYLPDVEMVCKAYTGSSRNGGADWSQIGESVGNYLCYGEFPSTNINDPASFLIPRGVILGRDLSRIYPIDATNAAEFQEFIAHSWYSQSAGKSAGVHPWSGETTFNYTGPAPGYTTMPDNAESYSWIKSPRWKGRAMEVGPLAHVLMMYAGGNTSAKNLVHKCFRTIGWEITPHMRQFHSTLGRTLARAIETKLVGDGMVGWYAKLMANINGGDVSVFDNTKWSPTTWSTSAKGYGFTEAPRGALGHWVVIENQKIKNYQCVVASQWNAGPRDAAGVAGPYEAGLQGHPIEKFDQPIEILRTIHSFDPCIGCAVHLTDPDGKSSVTVDFNDFA